ncbi:PLP-dependent aminotransferase family protein [Pseudoalteromonas citrea]|uniref:PLP-dependent aminotransferase family protein n=1 Tax=Pseudoalteromonas citrea TaxID=43655 RepID=A0A5S3XUJ6_9GAMM|nr:PLP-dependent aminotransferase family protein [Pseudoalteromonas citrea]TMP44739.1 PLP-dependent aminotransferase family protein [Pseudoalteromonas citrea]TMP61112.1 PLP-dependent aminotransferase family protein [Pseudoalteromonas citrea]
MSEYKYKALQGMLEHNIKAGVFSNKLPSIRAMAKNRQVSMSTVQKAYEGLELLGLIQARPKQGYFICEYNELDYGSGYQRIVVDELDEQQVLLTLNDENLVPLSATAPSSVLNNHRLLSQLHNKSFDKSMYQFRVKDDVQGGAQLRQTISQFLWRQDHVISPENIHIISGRREGLVSALTASGALGNTVAVESPTSFYFQSVIMRLCKNIIEIPMQTRFINELQLLDQAHKAYGFSTYLVNPSFNDPTGRVLSYSDKCALLAWAEQNAVTIIEYDRSELYFGTNKPVSLAQLASGFPKLSLISIQGFFDTVSTRICLGFAICINTGQVFAQAKHTLTEEPNLHTQNVINELICSGNYEKLLCQLRNKLRENYHCTLKIFEANLPNYITFLPVQGGPCCWFFTAEKSSSDIWQLLINEGVAIAPGAMFGSNDKFEHYCRITFALPWNPDLAIALKKFCQVY